MRLRCGIVLCVSVLSSAFGRSEERSPFCDCRVVSKGGAQYAVLRLLGDLKVAPIDWKQGECGTAFQALKERGDRQGGAFGPVCVTIATRAQNSGGVTPAITGWVRGNLIPSGVPISKEVAIRQGDSKTGGLVLGRPPRKSILSSTGLGVLFIGDWWDSASVLRKEFAALFVSPTGKRLYRFRLAELLTETEIASCSNWGDHTVDFFDQAWINETKRSAYIVKELHIGPNVQWRVIIIDLVEGKMRRGNADDIMDSISASNVNALYAVLPLLEGIGGKVAAGKLHNILDNGTLPVGIRTMAASLLLRVHRDERGKALLESMRAKSKDLAARDKKQFDTIRWYPSICDALGYDDKGDEYAAMWCASQDSLSK